MTSRDAIDDALVPTASSRIPSFRTIEEEAEFWDTHDLTEFDDEFEIVEDLKIRSMETKDSLTLRIDGEEFAALSERARELGMDAGALAWKLILDGIKR